MDDASSTKAGGRGRLDFETVISALLVLGLLAWGAGVAWAQNPSSGFEGFKPTEDYVLEIDGTPDSSAEIFFSRELPAFLLISEKQASPLLLAMRTQQVQTVHIMKVAKQSDGSVDLLANPILGSTGAYELAGPEIRFQVEGRELVFKEKPVLLGRQNLAGMRAYSEDYIRLADEYSPSREAIEALRRNGDEIKVQVYFGSWCPFCQTYVPRMMKVAQELQKTNVKFAFYGLPRDIKSDPVSAKVNVRGVPTGIVYVGGKEAGRIMNDQWRAPELAISRLVAR